MRARNSNYSIHHFRRYIVLVIILINTICTFWSVAPPTPNQYSIAQFIAVCSASTLAEKRSISSLLWCQPREKRGALSRPTRAHVHQLQPTTNSDKLSELP